jgi:ATP-binding cassette subfamily B protein
MGFFARVYNQWADSMNSAKRMFEIMDAIPEVKEAPDALRLEKPKGEISLQNVTFGYTENKTVLKDITLKIPAGSMLGIVGRSGAGKTTIVNLISRLYDPVEGQITIDGIDIKKICFHDLRKNVAMVSQETYIFMGTVADNIAYGNPEAGRMEIFHAAKLAGAHEFIMGMPDAYDTRIGASGRELSGGERQRISIARAILANPKILILDEATASVDTETERLIQKSINYLVKGRTTISIAHRLSTLRDADYLVVIEQGKITEQGTRDELFKLHGTYYKLLELQTKALAIEHLPCSEG